MELEQQLKTNLAYYPQNDCFLEKDQFHFIEMILHHQNRRLHWLQKCSFWDQLQRYFHYSLSLIGSKSLRAYKKDTERSKLQLAEPYLNGPITQAFCLNKALQSTTAKDSFQASFEGDLPVGHQ